MEPTDSGQKVSQSSESERAAKGEFVQFLNFIVGRSTLFYLSDFSLAKMHITLFSYDEPMKLCCSWRCNNKRRFLHSLIVKNVIKLLFQICDQRKDLKNQMINDNYISQSTHMSYQNRKEVRGKHNFNFTTSLFYIFL